MFCRKVCDRKHFYKEQPETCLRGKVGITKKMGDSTGVCKETSQSIDKGRKMDENP